MDNREDICIHCLYLLVSLQKVDNKLKELERRKFGKDSLIRVAVVGCGYSGVELAATVSERLQDRGLVQAINVNTTILPTAPPGNREAALKVRYLDFGSGKHVFFFLKKKILTGAIFSYTFTCSKGHELVIPP